MPAKANLHTITRYQFVATYEYIPHSAKVVLYFVAMWKLNSKVPMDDYNKLNLITKYKMFCGQINVFI